MSDHNLLPTGPSRTFASLGVTNLNCAKARPGYSIADGEGHAPQLVVGGVTDDYETNDRYPILPTRIEWITDGPIVMRYIISNRIAEGLGAGTGPLYYDDTRDGIAGQVLDKSPDWIVASGTTAEFSLSWPRR